MSHENPTEVQEILATALEAEAQLQEEGQLSQLGAAYDPTLIRVLEVDSNYGTAVAVGFEFWDNWVDAANHEWQHHEPIQADDWPRYARLVATALRAGELPTDPVLLQHVVRKPRRSLLEWLRDVLGLTE